jgi:hypothetical protein
MPDDQVSPAGSDPGLHGEEPSEQELAEEDRVRSNRSLAELMGDDAELDSSDVPLRERSKEPTDGR